eukprot:750493-Hanusia_phi.AAC.2
MLLPAFGKISGAGQDRRLPLKAGIGEFRGVGVGIGGRDSSGMDYEFMGGKRSDYGAIEQVRRRRRRSESEIMM